MEEIELPKAQQGLTVGPDQVLIIRLNASVSVQQARDFRDIAVKQGQEAGIRMLVVVADEIAAATPRDDSQIIGYRVAGLLYDPVDVTIVRRDEYPQTAAEIERRRTAGNLTRLTEDRDLGDDPDGDNTPGMGDH